MPFINRGDLLKANGRPGIALTNDYVHMTYTLEDRELIDAGMEAGTAGIYVDVLFTDNGQKSMVHVAQVENISAKESRP